MKFISKPKKARRILVRVIAAFLIALFATTYTVPALAANLKNTEYAFSFSGTGTMQYTRGRAKDTYSVCYLRVSSVNANRFNFYIQGQARYSNIWTNRTRNGVAVVYYPGHYSIHNYVYENGERFARLAGTSPAGGRYVSGMWSPDSAESNPSLN